MFSSLTKISSVSADWNSYYRENQWKAASTLTMLLLGVVSMALLVAGCGGEDTESQDFSKYEDNSAVLAQVGKGQITANYYEDRLKNMEAGELPLENGSTVDTATDLGKQAFLQILINKELMHQKALQLGYGLEPQMQDARKSMLEYDGGMALWNDKVMDVSATVSEEELQDFYSKMGLEYVCNYIITDLEESALAARDFARTGADWEDVIDQYHDGATAVTNKFIIRIPYGQYSSSFEDKVFAIKEGEITEPIFSSNGYWVMRVVEVVQNDKPSLEKAKPRVLDVTRNRKIGKIREEYKETVKNKYSFVINNDALWTVYQGLPANGLMDPETKQPWKKEQLEDLDIKSADLGTVFYSYRNIDDELIETQIADYKIVFDKMSVFQRPKKDEMLGGLRRKIEDEINKGLLNIEAEKNGYFERPDIIAQVDKKLEKMMVERLYKEALTFNETVSPEELDAFWAEHQGDYFSPESRSGHLVVCLTRQKAELAHKAILDGTSWKKVLIDYGSEAANKKRGGKTEFIPKGVDNPLSGPLFELEVGGVSQPIVIGDRYGIVQLDSIKEPKTYQLHEVSEAIGGRILGQRQEVAFQTALAQWKEELGVEIFADQLQPLKSWEELTTYVTPENLIPRN